MTTKGRLTRQELGWLLTQEAQGAAERLRKGVQVLTKTIPPMADTGTQSAVDDTLAALDDAMGMLSSLHPKPVSAKGRRGRIDLASLLWEIAPDARVSIEPGSGTEVYGDEGELRRMLHMLVGPGSRSGSAIVVRRVGEEVRLVIELGPDSSATSESERAWLHRMAIRYGGRYELTGGGEVLALPADKLENRSEEEKLRRQLDEARRQGQAYARELAAVVSQGEDIVAPSTFPTGNHDRFASLSRMAGGVASDLRTALSPIGWDLLSLIDHKDFAQVPGGWEQMVEKLEAIQKRIMLVQDLVGELANVGELDPHDAHVDVDLFDIAHASVRHATLRAQKAGVELSLQKSPADATKAIVRAAPRALSVVFRQMIGHALVATPRGRHVHVTVSAQEEKGLGARITVDDSGPFVPAAEARSYLMLEVDPATFGRPSSLALHLAAALMETQNGAFEVDGSPLGGIRSVATFSRK